MSKIVIIGSGMMGSAMAFPCRDRGHQVHVVGTPLDNAIITGLKENGYHLTMRRGMPPGCRYYLWDEAEAALAGGADVVVGGVSSFGVDWFMANVLPILPKNTPLLSVTKGLRHMGGGELLTFPQLYAPSVGPAQAMSWRTDARRRSAFAEMIWHRSVSFGICFKRRIIT